MKKFRYALEAVGLFIMLAIFSSLSAKNASNFGAWVGKKLSTRLGASKKALRHISHALPDMATEKQQAAIEGMWVNLAQIMAEYPHLETLGKNNVEILGLEKLIELRDDGKAAIFFGAHCANWEIASPAFYAHDLEMDLVYRAPNNPWADKMLDRMRSMKGKLRTYPKSTQGTRQLVKAIKNGRHVGILIDQKYNEGLPIPFFGIDAMTSPAFVQLAQKFECPLIPTQVERIGKNNFRITLHSELKLFNEDGTKKPIEPLINEAHTHLESWIKATPTQWLWLHKRWGKNVS